MECKKCGSKWVSSIAKDNCPFCGTNIVENLDSNNLSECKKCNSRWNTNYIIQNCPFCGEAISVNPQSFHEVKSVLKYIISHNGIEIYKKPSTVLALISDIAPQFTSERRLLKVCMESIMFSDFLLKKDVPEQRNLIIQKMISYLHEEYFLDKNMIQEAINWILFSIDDNVSSYIDSSYSDKKDREPHFQQINVETKKTIKIGDLIKYGPYNWVIIAEENDKVLLLSDSLIEKRQFNKSSAITSWEKCDLRVWLNTSFKNQLSVNEDRKIVPVKLSAVYNAKYNTQWNGSTVDSVFILSVEEIKNYVPKHRRMRDNYYWVRTPGNGSESVVVVDTLGDIYYSGRIATHNSVYVRPAMWIEKV